MTQKEEGKVIFPTNLNETIVQYLENYIIGNQQQTSVIVYSAMSAS